MAGVAGSIVAGSTLSDQAFEAWHAKADNQARLLTSYFDNLLIDARTIVRALSAQVSRDDALTGFMFRATIELAQEPDALFRLAEAAFVQRVTGERRGEVEAQLGEPLHIVGNGAANAPDAYEHFAVMLNSTDARMLSLGTDLSTEPALHAAVATAYRRPNEVIASPVFERGGSQWVALAERPVFPGQRSQSGLVVALIDFSDVIAHVHGLTPAGLQLHLTQRGTEWEPVSHIESVTPRPADPAAAIDVLDFRLVHGEARLTFDWYLFEAFDGGPATGLGTVVTLGGVALTLLLGTLVGVLAVQNAAIRRSVALRTQELEATRDEAEAANRAKSEFLASVSHELRTPLNAIIGFSEVIMREVRGPIGHPRYSEYARDIHTSGRHLLGVINSIIDLSAIESGEFHLNEEPVSLQASIDAVIRIIGLSAEKRGLTIKRDVPAALPRLLADKTAIEQILINLGTNAVQFTPKGGTVAFAAGQSGDAIWLMVSDTGIGMDAAEQQRALQPFGQVVSPMSRVSQGAGLGLPIAKELAQRHGGVFELTSRPGEGTRIRILFDSSRTLVTTARADADVA
ncbi:MAG: ATP-binding protein [Alphaproteobacteria bacterium]